MLSTFDYEKLDSLLQDFYHLSGIRITIFDDSFQELVSYPAALAPICQYIRTNPEAETACHACDRKACMEAARKRRTIVYRCHAGLTEAVSPVFVGNLPAAYLLFGHLLSYPSQYAGWDAIRRSCEPYHLDEAQLKDYVSGLPITEEAFILSASHILQAVASWLCMDRMVTLRQQGQMVQIDTYITEHYTEAIDAAFLCEQFQVGKTSLYAFAKQNYGCGIAEHIRRLRIEHAKKLLTEHQELGISEIAEACGFNDYNYFITVFKRVTGTSPRKYRGAACP